MLAFKAFLSHRYRSPAVNLYFFGLFHEVAEVQFEVDIGVTATSVTRLERMIRGSDAFIGIYPVDERGEGEPSWADLRDMSRYFRLELGLALRSRRPAIVFHDRRYRAMFRGPAGLNCVEFDAAEITGAGESPSAERFRRAFRAFCETVSAWRTYDVTRPQLPGRSRVALALPPRRRGGPGYSPSEVQVVTSRLEENGFTELHEMPWPPVLDAAWAATCEDDDWVITDVGDPLLSSTVLPYLHGSFVPTMRLRRTERGGTAGEPSPVERALYGAYEVGYPKDVVQWTDARSLRAGLDSRLSTLTAGIRRVSAHDEAVRYFSEAALRKEVVFFSYSSRDADLGADVATALKRRFQSVFDYRDGGSITPGEPWLEEIFNRLSRSAVGVPLLSEGYLASGNCMHELREIMARCDSGHMRAFPLKARKEELQLPAFLGSTQYLRVWEYPDVEGVVDAIVSALQREGDLSAA